MDESLYRLLNKLKERCGVYIGGKSLVRLVDFVDGYIECMYERDGVVPKFLYGFQQFVENYYGLQDVSVPRHWSNIILFFNVREEDAFDEFYKLLEKFLIETKDINIDDYVKQYSEEQIKRWNK